MRCFSLTHSASSLACRRVSCPMRSSRPESVLPRTTKKVASARAMSDRAVMAMQIPMRRARRLWNIDGLQKEGLWEG